MTRQTRMKSVRALLIDDNQHDRELFARLLTKRGVLSVEPQSYAGDSNLLSLVETKACDVVLVDYQLVEQKLPKPSAPQLGSTVAAFLRERMPNTPVLLITRGSLFRRFGLAGTEDESASFDDIFVKDDVSRSPARYRDEVLAIVRGFARLRRVAPYREWDVLCKLLGASEHETVLLRDAGPLRVPIDNEGWRVQAAARWVRRTLLRYPGILYNGLYAASALGLSETSFRTPAIQKWFEKARYTGPFAPSDGAWWKNRLIDKALSFLAKSGQQTSAVFRFGSTWNACKRASLRLSRCIVDGTSPAECVCHILLKPVKRSNSLPYRPDNRPSVMDEARVSFTAVRESQDFDERLVAPDVTSEVIRGIQRSSKYN
jgi:CheY-like chemotaxis protein